MDDASKINLAHFEVEWAIDKNCASEGLVYEENQDALLRSLVDTRELLYSVKAILEGNMPLVADVRRARETGVWINTEEGWMRAYVGCTVYSPVLDAQGLTDGATVYSVEGNWLGVQWGVGGLIEDRTTQSTATCVDDIYRIDYPVKR